MKNDWHNFAVNGLKKIGSFCKVANLTQVVMDIAFDETLFAPVF